MKKKLFSILLSLAMVITMMPMATMTALAGEEPPEITLYWGYDDSSKTLYLSAKETAITELETKANEFNSAVSYIQEFPWKDYREDVERVEILNDIAPESTAFWFQDMKKLTEIKGIEHLDTSNVWDMEQMFYNCQSLKSVNVSGFDTSNVKNMYAMFYNCQLLESLDVSNFDTSNVKIMNGMFAECDEFTSIDLSNLNMSSVDDTNGLSLLFSLCDKLEFVNLSNVDASKVKSMDKMFYQCKALTSVDFTNFNTSSAEDMTSMFEGCEALTSLNLSSFDTSNVKFMASMFSGCKKLKSLNLSSFDTSKVTGMGSMFNGCEKLKSLDLSNFNTSNVTRMGSMFRNCTSLKSLDLSGFDMTSLSDATAAFNKAAITYIKTPKNVPNDRNVALPKLSNSMIWYDASANAVYGDAYLPKNLAQSKTLYACAVSEDIVNGTLTVQASGNTTVIITVTPFEGSVLKPGTLKAIYNDGNEDQTITPTATENPGEYSFTMPAYPVTVTAEFSKTLYWGYNESSKTFYLSASADAITDATPTSFDSTDSFNYGDNIPWKENNQNIEHIKILDDITPGKTAFWFKGMSNLTDIDGIEHLVTTNVTDMKCMFDGCSKLESLDLNYFNTSKVTDMNGMFKNCKALTSLDLSKFNTSKVTIMDSMFCGCEKLANLDIGRFDTSNVTNMNEMFGACHALEELDVSSFDTSKVTNMNAMFEFCYNLKSIDVSKFDTSKVKYMLGMFYDCKALTSLDLSYLDMSSVDSDNGTKDMFYGCEALEFVNLSNVNASNVKNMMEMFKDCKALTSINFTNFETSSAENMNSMFEGCEALTSLNLSIFDTSKVKNMASMFYGCKKLKSLNLSNFDTSNVTNMNSMFSGCTSLKSLDLSSFDMTSLTNANSVFNNAAITYIKTPKNLKKSVTLPKVDSPMVWCYADNLTAYENGNLPKNISESITLVAGVPVSECSALQEAIDKTSGDATTPATATTNFILANDLTAPAEDGKSITIPAGKDITLDLNGKVLNAGGKFGVIKVEEGGKLTVIDSKPETEHYFKVGDDGLWELTDTKTETTKTVKGGVITGGTAKNGGGVTVNGIFNMNGGNITGNTATDNGGGVFVAQSGEFNLSGGKITDNVSGGVLSNGNCTMSGNSIISHNTGTGVSANNGTFTMSGNSIISYNSVNSANAGGLIVGQNCKFTMSENSKISYNSSRNGPGGVTNQGTFKMIGGSIDHNTANSYGGIIVWTNGEIILGGTAQIVENVKGGTISEGVLTGGTANNVFLVSNKYIDLGTGTAAPANGMKIGVTTQTAPTETASVKITTNGESTDTNYFASDNDAYEVKFNTDHLELTKTATAGITTWSALQDAINTATEPTTIQLTQDLTAPAEGGERLVIPAGKNIVLDLNGHTLDRGLSEEATAVEKGNVITVATGGKLTIKDSNDSKEGKISGGNSAYGAAIISNGVTVLESGSITDCKALSKDYDTINSQFGRGGAIYVPANGKFTMSGGEIKNCSASVAGGAIFNVGTVDIIGGKIDGCSVSGVNDGGTVKAKGGAVYNFTTSYFTMTGGEISGNTFNNVADMRGAGVYAAADANVILGGTAKITDNTNGDNKASNLFLYDQVKVKFAEGADAPKSGMKIGVTAKKTPAEAAPVTIASNGNTDVVNYFFSDNSSYEVKLNNSSELELALKAKPTPGPAPTPSEPTIVVPVSGGEGKVEVSATVSGEKATVGDISEKDIEKVVSGDKGDAVVEIDLSGLDKTISEVELPVKTVEKIAEATQASGKEEAGMSVKMSAASVTFDAKATQAMVDQAEGNTIQLVVDDIKTVSLNAVQKEAVKKLDTAIIIDAYLVSNGIKLCTESKNGFAGGKATVALQYEIKNNRTPLNYKVFYVDDNGKLTNLKAKYNEETKSFVFDIEHFSNYAVAYDENGELQASKVNLTKTTTYKNGKIKLTFKRLKLSDGKKITSYQIYRSTSKKFNKNLKKYSIKRTADTKSYTWTNSKKLKKGTKYYYKVRGRVKLSDGTYAYTQWSTIKTAKCKKTR